MATYTLKLLIPRSLSEKQQGHTLLDLLTSHFPRHVPTTFGKSEPLRDRFDATAMDSVLNSWGRLNFLASREDPMLRLHVHFWPTPSRNPQHSSISIIRLESDRDEQGNAVCQFFYSACEAFQPDFAVAHILTQAELQEHINTLALETAASPNVAIRSADHMQNRLLKEDYASVLWGVAMANLNTFQLRKCLPRMYWITVFGPPYVEMFGEQRILTTPAYEVRKLSSGGIGVRLTTAIGDDVRSYEEFQSARSRAQEHLNLNAFFEASLPEDHGYNTPNFGVSSAPAEGKPRGIVATAGRVPPTKTAILEAIANRKKRSGEA